MSFYQDFYFPSNESLVDETDLYIDDTTTSECSFFCVFDASEKIESTEEALSDPFDKVEQWELSEVSRTKLGDLTSNDKIN